IKFKCFVCRTKIYLLSSFECIMIYTSTCLVTIAGRSHLFPCRTQKLSSLAPMVVGLTFRKSRTLPGKHIGCDEPRPRGLFFLQKGLDRKSEALENSLYEKAIEADELRERRKEHTSDKGVRQECK